MTGRLRVTTESGAVYLFDMEDDTVRRENDSAQKRGDEEWIRVIDRSDITLGERMLLVMESLAERGPDDYGTPKEEASSVTTRRTTPVTRIEMLE